MIPTSSTLHSMTYVHVSEKLEEMSQKREEMKNDVCGLLLNNLDSEDSVWVSFQAWGKLWVYCCFSSGIRYLAELQILLGLLDNREGQQKESRVTVLSGRRQRLFHVCKVGILSFLPTWNGGMCYLAHGLAILGWWKKPSHALLGLVSSINNWGDPAEGFKSIPCASWESHQWGNHQGLRMWVSIEP